MVPEKQVDQDIIFIQPGNRVGTANIHHQDVSLLEVDLLAVHYLVALSLEHVVDFDEFVRVLRVGGEARVLADVDGLMTEKVLVEDRNLGLIAGPGINYTDREVVSKYSPFFLHILNGGMLH